MPKRIRSPLTKLRDKARRQQYKANERAYREAERAAYFAGDTTFYARAGHDPQRVRFTRPATAAEIAAKDAERRAKLEAAETKYRMLARKYHPDVTGDDGASMRVLNDWIAKKRRELSIPG